MQIERNPTPDWSLMVKLATDWLLERCGPDYCDDNDWEGYFFEGVIQVMFGEDIFQKLRVLDKQRELERKRAELVEIEEAMKSPVSPLQRHIERVRADIVRLEAQ